MHLQPSPMLFAPPAVKPKTAPKPAAHFDEHTLIASELIKLKTLGDELAKLRQDQERLEHDLDPARFADSPVSADKIEEYAKHRAKSEAALALVRGRAVVVQGMVTAQEKAVEQARESARQDICRAALPAHRDLLQQILEALPRAADLVDRTHAFVAER